MRALVTGAAGQLGAVLVAHLRRAGYDVAGLTRATLDVTDHGAVRRTVAELRPALIANCTAFNDVDGAEDHPLEALETNAFAVRAMARAARDFDATFVHYSTDFVFAGDASVPYTEDDRAQPQSYYGISKLLGEWFAADAPVHHVFRVESLFGGPAARSSIDRIIDALRDGRRASAFVDRIVSPSYVEDVAAATLEACARRIPCGLYHCVNGGHTTWFELGLEVARLGGFDAGLLVPVKVADVTLKARRPQYCALSNAKLAAVGIVMPSWQDAVARYFAVRVPE